MAILLIRIKIICLSSSRKLIIRIVAPLRVDLRIGGGKGELVSSSSVNDRSESIWELGSIP